MRRILAIMVIASLAATGRADIFDLREHGKLVIYVVGDWHITSEDVGEYRIDLIAKSKPPAAVCRITVTTPERDDYSTRGRLTLRMQQLAERLIASGKFLEKKATIKPLYRTDGFGYYCLFTDPNLVGKPQIPNDFKQSCLGLLRLNPRVMIRFQILAEGELTEPFQQLLGMLEGMELRPK